MRSPAKEVDPALICKNCKNCNWVYVVTYCTLIATKHRNQSKEEIRCNSCGHKANVETNNYIRASKEFREIRNKENTKL